MDDDAKALAAALESLQEFQNVLHTHAAAGRASAQAALAALALATDLLRATSAGGTNAERAVCAARHILGFAPPEAGRTPEIAILFYGDRGAGDLDMCCTGVDPRELVQILEMVLEQERGRARQHDGKTKH